MEPMKTVRSGRFWSRSLFVAALVLACEAAPTHADDSYKAPVVTSTEPGFFRRLAAKAGMGTTSFFGNAKSANAVSANHDIPREVRSSFRAYNRPFFRRKK
jgi:hypothetical protein